MLWAFFAVGLHRGRAGWQPSPIAIISHVCFLLLLSFTKWFWAEDYCYYDHTHHHHVHNDHYTLEATHPELSLKLFANSSKDILGVAFFFTIKVLAHVIKTYLSPSLQVGPSAHKSLRYFCGVLTLLRATVFCSGSPKPRPKQAPCSSIFSPLELRNVIRSQSTLTTTKHKHKHNSESPCYKSILWSTWEDSHLAIG